MGCFGSRLSNRTSVCDNIHTVGCQFTGGEGQQIDWCPVDKYVVQYYEENKGDVEKLEELAAFFKVEGLTMDEENAKKMGLQIHKACGDNVTALKGAFGEDMAREGLCIMDKYTLKEGVESM